MRNRTLHTLPSSRPWESAVTLACLVLLMASTRAVAEESGDWFCNPFTADSAHHRPIGTGAEYAAVDHPAVKDWLKGSQLNINSGSKPHGLFMIDAGADGPLITVGARADAGHIHGLPATVRFPAGGVPLDFPAHFDGNIAIFDRSVNQFAHFRQYAWNQGNPVAGQYRRYEPVSAGHGARLADRIGTSASGVAAPFGILRGWELKKEGHRIGHALQMVLPRLPDNSVMMLSREVWWPAVGMDGSAYTKATHNTGNIPYGSLWAVPPVSKGGPDLTKLGLSEMGLRLAECMRDYGIYVVDGGGSPSLRCDQGVDDIHAELVASTRAIYKHIRLVVNSVPDRGKVIYNVGDSGVNPTGGPNKQIVAGDFPAGGGDPLAPNTAIDADSR